MIRLSAPVRAVFLCQLHLFSCFHVIPHGATMERMMQFIQPYSNAFQLHNQLDSYHFLEITLIETSFCCFHGGVKGSACCAKATVASGSTCHSSSFPRPSRSCFVDLLASSTRHSLQTLRQHVRVPGHKKQAATLVFCSALSRAEVQHLLHRTESRVDVPPNTCLHHCQTSKLK